MGINTGGYNQYNFKHGLYHHPIYSNWNAMMNRCYNKTFKQYFDYGGRGIKVCDRWHDVKNFIEDMYVSYHPGLTLDRIDNNGNYELNNCRWATYKEQMEDHIQYYYVINNITKSLKEWCEEYSISYNTAYCRIKRGVDPIVAITNKKISNRGNYRESFKSTGKDLFS